MNPWLHLGKITITVIAFFLINEWIYLPLFTTSNPRPDIYENRDPITTISVHLAIVGTMIYAAKLLYDLTEYAENQVAILKKGEENGNTN